MRTWRGCVGRGNFTPLRMSAIGLEPAVAASFAARWPRLRVLLAKFARFTGWQGAAQGLQLLLGLLLVRWLSFDDYAAYGLVTAFQLALVQLSDLGVSDGVLALVGTRTADRVCVGRYVAAAWAQRGKMLLIIAPIAAVVFFELVRRHQWPWAWSAVLLVSIFAFLYFQGLGAVWSPVLLMHGKMSALYRPRVVLAAVLLGVACLLHAGGLLGAAGICWLNTIVLAGTALLYRRAAGPLAALPERADPEAERELRRYISPLLAGAVFFAFHGQIQLFLISIFGGARALAEVTALGRVGQLVTFVMAFLTTLLVPAVARANKAMLGCRYMQTVAVVLCFGAALIASAVYFPRTYLLLLGPKYHGLEAELLLAVIGAVAGLTASCLFFCNNSRRWVSHGITWICIGGGILIDLIFIRWGNLSQPRGVLLLSAVGSAFPIIPFSIYGAWRYLREMETEEPR